MAARAVSLLAIAAGACAVETEHKHHGHHHNANLRHSGEAAVEGLEFKHRLRVCNAYPYTSPIDVYRGGSEKLTGTMPMPYKTCRDFSSPLIAGDKLEFKVGDANAGTFTVSDLPNNDAVLLLVISRHDTLSTAVSFESHVFANLANAQVAIIDTYKGHGKSVPHISEVTGPIRTGKARIEELRYNSVVAVNPGKYAVALDDKADVVQATAGLVALNRESYVVLRVGVQAQQGESFPEELVVFPQSDPAYLRSGAKALASSLAMTLPLFVAMVFAA